MEFRDDGLDARDDALCPRLPLVAVTNTTERDRLSADEDPEGHSAVGILCSDNAIRLRSREPRPSTMWAGR